MEVVNPLHRISICLKVREQLSSKALTRINEKHIQYAQFFIKSTINYWKTYKLTRRTLTYDPKAVTRGEKKTAKTEPHRKPHWTEEKKLVFKISWFCSVLKLKKPKKIGSVRFRSPKTEINRTEPNSYKLLNCNTLYPNYLLLFVYYLWVEFSIFAWIVIK